MLTTPTNIPPYPEEIDSKHKILTIGSCFSQHIGDKLEASRFLVHNNIFGTLFNPVSISNVLYRASAGQLVEANEIGKHADVFYHFDFHSSYSGVNKKRVLTGINSAVRKGKKALRASDWLIITLGTSTAYTINDGKDVVANCHKLPSENFSKRILGLGHMKEALLMAIGEIMTINPKIQIVMTVSPVRHIKDGILENSRSKSRLIELVNQLSESIDYIHYFPAYEIMLDELRDYRYYKRDLIHPSDVAIDYIWEKFQETFFTPEAMTKVKMADEINRALDHRPIVPDTESHKSFLQHTMNKIHAFKEEYPEVNMTREIKALQKKIGTR